MDQCALFAAAVTHYSPNPNLTGARNKRVALCGVPTVVGSDCCGSSNLRWVECGACLALVEQRARLAKMLREAS